MNEGRLSELEAFLAVAETGGFGVAARTLGLTQSTVSRQLAALERRLGVGLVSRTTRSVALTAAGSAFAEEVRDLVTRLRDAEARVARGDEAIAGTVRMTMPTAYGRAVVIPVLGALMAQHPALRFEVDLSDRYLDLQSGLDIAIRFSDETPSGWICHGLGRHVGRLCAAPTYLARSGPLRSHEDLGAHVLLVARTYTPRTTWSFDTPEGRRTLDVAPAAIVSDFTALCELALSGAGIAALPGFLADRPLSEGRLVEVLSGHFRASAQAFAVVRHDMASAPRVRVTLDALRSLDPKLREGTPSPPG